MHQSSVCAVHCLEQRHFSLGCCRKQLDRSHKPALGVYVNKLIQMCRVKGAGQVPSLCPRNHRFPYPYTEQRGSRALLLCFRAGGFPGEPWRGGRNGPGGFPRLLAPLVLCVCVLSAKSFSNLMTALALISTFWKWVKVFGR